MPIWVLYEFEIISVISRGRYVWEHRVLQVPALVLYIEFEDPISYRS